MSTLDEERETKTAGGEISKYRKREADKKRPKNMKT